MMNKLFTLLLFAASCLTATGQVPDYVPTEGLVGWFDFLTDGCDAVGQSGCFDLLNGSIVESVDGAHGGALRLTGNYAELPPSSVLNLSEFTIAFRYYFESGSRMRLWKGDPEYPADLNFLIKGSNESVTTGFNYSPDCSTIAENTSNAVVVAPMNVANSWIDLVLSRTEGGEVVISTSSESVVVQLSETICTESNPIRLGHWWDSDPNPSNGWVDHVGFWNRVLTVAERDMLLSFGVGCTQSEACNYNPNAVIDDGSCLDCEVFAERCGSGTMWDPISQTCTIDETYCSWQPDSDGDQLIGVSDLLMFLSVFGDTDLDQDGIFDSNDDCVGEYDECGVCNGSGPSIPIIESVEILYDSLYAEQIDEWWVFEVGADTLFTYVCELIEGCTDLEADNFYEEANYNDGSCVYWNGCGDHINYEGYSYETVQIGSQCWFAENCRYMPFILEGVVHPTVAAVMVQGYQGNSLEEAAQLENYVHFGALYNYQATEEIQLCPSGWHVPTDAEYQTLEISMGMSPSVASETFWRGNNEGTKMKSSDDWNGTDAFGFNALPAGTIGSVVDDQAYFWTSSSGDETAWHRVLATNRADINRNMGNKQLGYSVRCIKDSE